MSGKRRLGEGNQEREDESRAGCEAKEIESGRRGEGNPEREDESQGRLCIVVSKHRNRHGNRLVVE
jgi:hypothetical protein